MTRLTAAEIAAAQNAREPRAIRDLSDRAAARGSEPTNDELATALHRLVGGYLRPCGELSTPESEAYDQIVQARRARGIYPPPSTGDQGEVYVLACTRCSVVFTSRRIQAQRCEKCQHQTSLAGGFLLSPNAWRCTDCGEPAYGVRRKKRCEECAIKRRLAQNAEKQRRHRARRTTPAAERTTPAEGPPGDHEQA